MRLLIDLRSINYGRSGGIENYAYYVIDCLKQTDLEIILDVSPFSKKIYEQKYKADKNIKIICDPVLEKLNNFIQFVFPGKFKSLGDRKSWAMKAKSDFVFLPNHMSKYQYLHLPGIITMHAFMPEYDYKIKHTIKYNTDKAVALITSWNYPYQEFIKTFPQHKSKWFLIPYIAAHNVDANNQKPIENLPDNYFLYVAFFSERKNQLRLVEAYSIAKLKNAGLPKLVLAGGVNNEYKINVRERVKELKLSDDVLIYDYLPDENISYLYHNCYAAIAPTLWEAASGAVLEATYCGKPVLCSDIPPLRDFAKYFELNMMFFNPNSITEMANNIIECYKYYATFKNFGEDNMRRLQKYDQIFFTEDFVKILNHSLKR
jgi:glycosyltransferase involved in cell wall biosynthesis